MKRAKFLIIICFLIIGYSCSDDHPVIKSDTDAFTGKWQLTGTQFSPGYPVPVSSVSATPPQVLLLNADSTASSTLEGMHAMVIKSYAIHYDTLSRTKAFYAYSDSKQTPDSLRTVFKFSRNGNELRLGNIGCFEQCDLIFTRIP